MDIPTSPSLILFPFRLLRPFDEEGKVAGAPSSTLFGLTLRRTVTRLSSFVK